MHLKPGKATYRLRNVGILQCAFYYRARGEPYYSMQLVELPRLLELRHGSKTERGTPRYFAYCFERHTIELHPPPATFGELEVRYYPPLEVA